MPLAAGTRLGSYEILSLIGCGGMGEVYRARDGKLGRDIALKILPEGSLSDDLARQRLIREARLAASLNHPSICTMHDVDEAGGLVYVAMELVEGTPLADLIPPGGLPVDRVLQYALPIAEGLALAHERGIVHRDLKGANVSVLPDDRIKILDFGLAARQPGALQESTQSMSGFDTAGTVAGTLAYMSPEALRGERADVRTDVWSFGVLLHEMLSGHRPFQSRSGAELTSSILRDPPAALPPTVPPGLAAIVQRCLSKEPARRYAHAGEVRAALEAAGAGAPRSSHGRVSRRKALMAVAAAIAAAAAALLVAGRVWRAPTSRTDPTRIQSLAVLPLENLSGDPAQDYFSDGLTEELISRLSGVTGLAVTSRTSVMRFKRSTRPVPEIARELGVQAIVEGTVARSGEQIRVTARLVDAAADKPLWADHYDRPLKDVLTIQADVASAIGEAIRTSITPQSRSRLASVPTTNSAAYDLYLRGRFHLARENPGEIRQGIYLLEQAVEADPQFAAAYAELARGYSARLFYADPGDTSLQERAFVAVERALALDPNLDTAHLARGLTLWIPTNHFPHERAIASYQRAIALNPSADEAHHQLGLVYLHIGLLDEGAREIREALRLNPANELARFRQGVIALYQARYTEAADVFSRTPKGFQPPLVAFQLADALFHLGRKVEARQTATDYLREHPDDLGGLNYGMRALLAADDGDSDAMAAAVKTAQEKGKGYGHFHHTAFTLARAYAIAGRAREAVDWLQQAADDGYPCYPAFLNDSTLDRIRGDRRFQDFMAQQKVRFEAFKKLAQ